MSPSDHALFPEVSVVCTGCGTDFPVGDGLGPVEILWMHDHDCPAGVTLADPNLAAPGCDQFQAA
jgi:hypothetical protein